MRRLALTIALSVATLAASAQPADSAEQLVDRFQQALTRADMRAYQSLFAFSAQSDEAATLAQFKQRTGMKRRAVKLMPFSTYEKEYKAALQRGAKPIVEPKAWLVVEYEPAKLAGGGTSTETDILLIGLKGGKYVFSS